MTLAAVKRELCSWLCAASLKQDLVPDAQGHSRAVPEVPGFRFPLHKLHSSSCLPVAPLIKHIYLFLQDLLKWSSVIPVGWWALLGPKESTRRQHKWHYFLGAGNEGNISSCQSIERLEQAPGRGNTSKTSEQHLSTLFPKAESYTPKYFLCILDIGLSSHPSLIFERCIQMKSLRSEDGMNHLKITEGFKDSYKTQKWPRGTEDERQLNRIQGMSYWCNASTAAASHLMFPKGSSLWWISNHPPNSHLCLKAAASRQKARLLDQHQLFLCKLYSI